jgi:Tol biopolymer transport system component
VNLDDRARRAADDIRREVGEPDVPSAHDPFERFEHSRASRARNQRIVAGSVALGLATLGVVFAVRALGPTPVGRPAAPALPSGTILYGEWDQRISQARWFTVGTDGSNLRDLDVLASCAEWFPDGSRILITNDADRGPGNPLRPAVIQPDGSGREALGGTPDRDLELGCGDVSPDGTRIVLEGFNEADTSHNGIYSIRATDGGGLVRLTNGPDTYPQFAPDGTRVVFMRTKAGVQPEGAGALFVVGVDGTRARRITPWGAAFLDQAWSPDGQWIVFQRPYGRLFLVHPDGTGLHEVPIDLPAGSGASEPSWSPDGEWIAFVLLNDGASNVYAVRPDGTGLTRVTLSEGTHDAGPDWGP